MKSDEIYRQKPIDKQNYGFSQKLILYICTQTIFLYFCTVIEATLSKT